jgi:hypothetical protein
MVKEKRFDVVNAHAEPTVLRVILNDPVGVELWLGKQQGRDYPRLASLNFKQAKELAFLLAQMAAHRR